jgi:hypothetical protein
MVAQNANRFALIGLRGSECGLIDPKRVAAREPFVYFAKDNSLEGKLVVDQSP